MKRKWLGKALLAAATALLLSCGGGGGGGGPIYGAGTPATTGAGAGGATDTAGAPGATGTTGSTGTSGTTGTATSGTAGDAGGLGGVAADDGAGSSTGGSTATASSGDGSGVGSGGTGVSTADATGVGAVDGAGSIIVNGLRYDTTGVVGSLEDAAGLQLGMTAKVTGPVNADFTSGVARRVESAADFRGPLAAPNLAQGSFTIFGTTVTTDEATVWADASGLSAIPAGRTVQVWGLPAAPGVLRATRIEQRIETSAILTGTLQNLDTGNRSFVLGGALIDYADAALPADVAEGSLVRVRATLRAAGRLSATLVQRWYPVPVVEGSTAHLAGVVTGYAGLGSLRVLGLAVDASAAQITGGPAGAIGNGVKVEVGGVWRQGVLQATRLKIRHVPGTGGPVSFDLNGSVGAFRSAADFRVRGQPVDASGPGVVFGNGTAANLRNGAKVRVQGSQVVDGVLIATRVDFQ